MFQRLFQQLLSQFGLGYYLPNSSELGLSGSNAPETDGQAEVAFLPGKRAQIEAETEETLDERRQNLTDSSLVWPGKTDTFNYQNDEPVDYRVSLTITDLEPSYYMRRPAIGGQWQQDQSVLLQPGQQTKFEVVFTQPPNVENAARRSFSYVLTLFDPRRANDQGEVVGDVPMRWVPLPKSSDLKIGANPPVVIARPWRRAALFNLEFLNRSQLPPSVSLNILRAENKAKLDAEPEQVATVSQSLPSLTPGVWRIIIPPPAARGSYLATISGTAKVADGKDYPLHLAKPVFVRYVPWLRAFKDWLVLLGSLFLLLLIIYGIPARRGPTVRLQVEKLSPPPKGVPGDIGLNAFPLNGEQEAKEGLPMTRQSDGSFLVDMPPRLMGYRPFFGWNTKEPYRFHVRITRPSTPAYEGYPSTATPKEGDTFEAKMKGLGYSEDWVAVIPVRAIEPPWKAGDPHIDTCAPDLVKIGKDAAFTLTGTSFGDKRGFVKFDDKPASRILSWSDKTISVLMLNAALTKGPHGLSIIRDGDNAASSPVSVTVDDGADKKLDCGGPGQPPCIPPIPPDPDCGKPGHDPCVPPTPKKPSLDAVSPANLPENKQGNITLRGRDFGDAGKVIFQNNGAEVSVSPVWGANSISFSVSALRRGHCSIRISNAAGLSNERSLTVTHSPPPTLNYRETMLNAFKNFFIADYSEGQKQISEAVKAKAKAVIKAADDEDQRDRFRDLYLDNALRSVAKARLHQNPDISLVEQGKFAGYLAMCIIHHREDGWTEKINGETLRKLAEKEKASLLKDCAIRVSVDYMYISGEDLVVPGQLNETIKDSQIRDLRQSQE